MADALYEQVYEASTPRTTREQVIAWYKQEYPGSRTNKAGKTTFEWQSRLATDLSNVTGIKRDSIMRRFQGSRKEREASKGHQDEYQALGESLPPLPPKGGYHIEGTVWIRFSDECEDRQIDLDIIDEDAAALAQLAYDDMGAEALINIYMGNTIDDEQGLASCHAPDLTVTPIEA